jgi:hypothetical protein
MIDLIAEASIALASLRARWITTRSGQSRQPMKATVYRYGSHADGDDRPVLVLVQMTHRELDALCHFKHHLTGIAKYALVEAICEGEAVND